MDMDLEAEPESPPPEEEMFVLDLFPLEVWEKIISYLRRPTDLASCYNATAPWKALLSRSRMTFMPVQMAKIFLMIDNRVHFSDREILSFRQISLSWKEAIDLFLQNHPHFFNLDFSKARTFPDPFLPIQNFKTERNTKFQRFLRRTDQFPNADPFFSRAFRYHELTCETQDALPIPSECHHYHHHHHRRRPSPSPPVLAIPEQRQLFRNILARFGTRIWHAAFLFTMKDTTPKDFYELVHSFLQLMPHLRSLWIRVEEGVINPHFMTRRLKNLVETQPLPPLEHLVMLGIRNVPEPLESGLLFTYKSVKRLSFQNNTGVRPSFPPGCLLNLNFTSLQHLRTFNYCVADIIMIQRKFSEWPLTHVNLRWIQVTDLDMVFRAVSGFSNTLEHLMMEFRGIRAHEFDTVEENLNLPRLETFKVTCVQSYLSQIDFLAPCLALRELEIDMWLPLYPSANPPPRSIWFAKCVAFMYTSNIWEVFKQLQKIRIKTVTNSLTHREEAVPAKHFFSRTIYNKRKGRGAEKKTTKG